MKKDIHECCVFSTKKEKEKRGMLRCDMRHKGKELCPEGHKDITFVAVILSNTCKTCKQIGYLTWREKKKRRHLHN